MTDLKALREKAADEYAKTNAPPGLADPAKYYAFLAGAAWVAEMIEKKNNDCPHPGCCCVCGHQGRCPEDGLTAGLSVAVTE